VPEIEFPVPIAHENLKSTNKVLIESFINVSKNTQTHTHTHKQHTLVRSRVSTNPISLSLFLYSLTKMCVYYYYYYFFFSGTQFEHISTHTFYQPQGKAYFGVYWAETCNQRDQSETFQNMSESHHENGVVGQYVTWWLASRFMITPFTHVTYINQYIELCHIGFTWKACPILSYYTWSSSLLLPHHSHNLSSSTHSLTLTGNILISDTHSKPKKKSGAFQRIFGDDAADVSLCGWVDGCQQNHERWKMTLCVTPPLSLLHTICWHTHIYNIYINDNTQQQGLTVVFLDAGLSIDLDEYAHRNMVSVLRAFTERDGRSAAKFAVEASERAVALEAMNVNPPK
jgi:hypothetical protein